MNDDFPPVKFLVIRFSSIGDIVLTTPVVRGLKQQVPNAEVHFLTKKGFESLVKYNPYIDKVHLYDGDLAALVKNLRQEEFHYIIDLHHNLRSQLVKLRLGVLAFSFDKLNWKKYLMVRFRINRLPDVHIVDRYLDTVRLFDVTNDLKGLDFFIPPEEEVQMDRFPEKFRGSYVVMATGAKHNTKQIPVQLMAEICSKSVLPVILLGGKEDRDRAEQVVALTGNAYNACGHFSLMQSAAILKLAKAVITPDTGLMHIGAALRQQIISVWGSTIPEFGMYPYLPGDKSKIFEVKGLSCRPCSKLGYSACPKGHFRCMKDQSGDAISAYVNKVIKEA